MRDGLHLYELNMCNELYILNEFTGFAVKACIRLIRCHTEVVGSNFVIILMENDKICSFTSPLLIVQLQVQSYYGMTLMVKLCSVSNLFLEVGRSMEGQG